MENDRTHTKARPKQRLQHRNDISILVGKTTWRRTVKTEMDGFIGSIYDGQIIMFDKLVLDHFSRF